MRRILADSHPVALRKSIDGLGGLGKSVWEEAPLAGSLCVVVTRRGHDVQLVSWERTGWCLVAQRWEQGRFPLPQAAAKPDLSLPVFPLLWEGRALGGRPGRGEVTVRTVEEQAASWGPPEIVARLGRQRAWEDQHVALQRQGDWFKRQLLGRQSAQRLRAPDPDHLALAGRLTTPRAPADQPPPPPATVTASQRRVRFTGAEVADESERRVESPVPGPAIVLTKPAVTALPPAAYEGSGAKVPSRWAQRPGASVLLTYRRPVINRQETAVVSCPPAPPAVCEQRFAAVRVLVGRLSDKGVSPVPLSRQPQRLRQAGMRLSRSARTQGGQRTAELVAPLASARRSSMLPRGVVTREDTGVKAGRRETGNLHPGYCWPLDGDQEAVACPGAASRAHAGVREAVGTGGGVLLPEGSSVDARLALQGERRVPAQGWRHPRRQVVEAARAEPRLVAEALAHSEGCYREAADLREHGWAVEAKRAQRGDHTQPLVEDFLAGLKPTGVTEVRLPAPPFGPAARAAREREAALKVCRADPAGPRETHPREREIRPLARGRKNGWCWWPEVGARQVGRSQSLLASCRRQGVAPSGDLVEVRQRVDTHPALAVHLLTPRLGQQHCADHPLRSNLDRFSH